MKEMPASKAYRLLEVGPVVLVTTARRVVPPMKSLRTFAPNARVSRASRKAAYGRFKASARAR